ncbi:MAG: class I SAM-dependent methyltransferase [Chlamydiae bacterium]|nr:class I SAM-dependent methyltransferase [Chlamydiota bacterium]
MFFQKRYNSKTPLKHVEIIMEEKARCSMRYDLDQNGEEILLKEDKFQVMMAWEKPYMEACIDALQPFGDVLEIGFGCGYSASHIQTYFPKSHTIIEFHPEVIKKANDWASHYPSVHLVEDTWQNALSSLGVFDAIFFDDYPLESEETLFRWKQEQESSASILQQGDLLLRKIHEMIPSLSGIKYAEEEVWAFLWQLQKKDPKEILFFINGLVSAEHIKATERSRLIERLFKAGFLTNEDVLNSKDVPPYTFNKKGDRLFMFLEKCLSSHMRRGSRFSCYLNNPTSKYQDKFWFEKIITNPFLDYEERIIHVEVPEHCDYYPHQEALVITITKK